ncbi:MAG: hypothetical protein D6784_18585 [Chloroflexi bacterium]|nr:MAG: hypothetical protein D6784_18585 [Chloroflexota bacterium]
MRTRSIVTALLKQAGLVPAQMVEHHNGTLTLKFEADQADPTGRFTEARKLAWQVLAALHLDQVIDYFDIVSGQQAFHVIQIDPSNSPLKQIAQLRGVKVKPARPRRPAIPFPVGAQVWVAVKYRGKPVRVRGTLTRKSNVAVVKSNRTGVEYEVPPHLVFASRPGQDVLAKLS